MSRALAGTTIVVTRARAQAAALADRLEALGAEVLEFPTIAFAEPEEWGPADEAISALDTYDWTVFTSANAVTRFADRLVETGAGVGALGGTKVLAVGPATADRLADAGVVVDAVPDDHRAEGVLSVLEERGVGAGSRVLIPRALVARETLPETLRAAGAVVDVVPVYRTVLGQGDPATSARLAAGDVDYVTFTSSSSVSNFMALVRGSAAEAGVASVGVACIGPVTSETARELGLEVDVEPEEYTVPALVEALVAAVEQV